MPRKILIVEDETSLLEVYRETLEGPDLEVLTAVTLLDALDLLKGNRDVVLIAVDGCFPHAAGESPYPEPGRACSGEKFIVNARFRGPTIACSSDDGLNRKMLAAGATHVSGKLGLCRLIRHILSSMPAQPQP